jgi:3-hydroxyisobutyrate dehydrogenase-like beta-hydroxyacid dehydrogenase
MTAKVGFIGTGSMGGAIARHLLSGGYELRVYDRRPEATAPLEAAGALVCPGPAALARECDVVLLSLPSHTEVYDVVFGPGGVLGALRPGGLIVNLTTGSVRALPRLAEVEHSHGIRYVTAPVSQGVDNAARGALSAFVAGTDEGLALALPVLQAFCAQVIRLPSHEAAMAAKIVTNLSWFINAAALGELMVLMVQAGIAREDVQRVLAASCGDSWVARHDIPSVLSDYDPTFTLGLADKDLGLAAELAGMLGVPLEVGAAARAVFDRALALFGPGAPELSPVCLMEQLTGTRLGLKPPDPVTSG